MNTTANLSHDISWCDVDVTLMWLFTSIRIYSRSWLKSPRTDVHNVCDVHNVRNVRNANDCGYQPYADPRSTLRNASVASPRQPPALRGIEVSRLAAQPSSPGNGRSQNMSKWYIFDLPMLHTERCPTNQTFLNVLKIIGNPSKSAQAVQSFNHFNFWDHSSKNWLI